MHEGTLVRIAILIDSLAIGGAQKHVRQLACGLAESKHIVTVYALNEIVEPMYRDPMVAAGVKVQAVGKARVISGIGLFQVAQDLWSERIDAVITVLFVSTLFGRIAAQIAGGIPVLTCLQARNVNYTRWQNAALRLTAPLTNFTVSNSRAALPWAAIHEGVDPRRSMYIPNAIDPPKPRQGPLPSWTELGLAPLEGKRVIGSLGRLDRQKGYDLLLDALARLPASERIGIGAVIFGEGPERKALEVQRGQLGLDGIVFFPGQRPDAADLLPKLNLYVQPSRFEGTPNAVMEALAAGLPVIASDVDGIRELDTHPRSEFEPSALLGDLVPLVLIPLNAVSHLRCSAPMRVISVRTMRMPTHLEDSFERICKQCSAGKQRESLG